MAKKLHENAEIAQAEPSTGSVLFEFSDLMVAPPPSTPSSEKKNAPPPSFFSNSFSDIVKNKPPSPMQQKTFSFHRGEHAVPSPIQLETSSFHRGEHAVVPSLASKSFSDLFSPQPSSPIPPKTPSTHRGEPAIVFSSDEIKKLSEPFQHALVGKFPKGRPSMEVIRKFFTALDLKGSVSVGLLDYRHILIRCSLEVDFLRIWARSIWFIQNYSMRIFRWTQDFHIDHESSLTPVWMSLPKLPIHFFKKETLFSIASIFGCPLMMDAATVVLSRPSVARILVEIDLRVTQPSRVWIGDENGVGFWQAIVLENLPKYCSNCAHVGHAVETCRWLHNVDGKVSRKPIQTAISQPHQTTVSQPKAAVSRSQVHALKRRPLAVKFVKWRQPPWPSCKLNTDGAASILRGAGGGVLRTSDGKLHFAFHSYFGRASVIEAEAKALLLGLALAISHGFWDIFVETDSLLLFHAVTGSGCVPWKIAALVRRILSFASVVNSFAHVFREGNQVADALAKIGLRDRSFVTYHSLEDLPSMVTKALRMDSLGLGVFRYTYK